jgi:hypothetical protein
MTMTSNLNKLKNSASQQGKHALFFSIILLFAGLKLVQRV